jgi:hypothetical protein
MGISYRSSEFSLQRVKSVFSLPQCFLLLILTLIFDSSHCRPVLRFHLALVEIRDLRPLIGCEAHQARHLFLRSPLRMQVLLD